MVLGFHNQVDGGVARRAVCVPFNCEFVDVITDPTSQKPAAHEDIRGRAWIAPNIPGLLYVLIQFYKSYWLSFGGRKSLGLMPAIVREATDDMLAAEGSGDLKDWVDDNMTRVASVKDASKRVVVLPRLRDLPCFRDLREPTFLKAVANVITFATRDGTRDVARETAGRRSCLKLN